MYNNLFSIGPVTIHGYGLMIAIGILAAYHTATTQAPKQDLDADRIFPLLICALVGGFGCSKLLFYITTWREILQNPAVLLDFSHGFVVYGGILGGILACWLYCRCAGLSFLRYADLILPAVALAQGFGRIGCLLAGCCYGMPTSSAFAITFQNSQLAPNGVPLVPTQPISSALDFLNFFALLWISRHKKKSGIVTACYLVFYSIGRFALEFFRGDLNRGAVGVLSTSQFLSLFVFVFGVGLLAARKKSV